MSQDSLKAKKYPVLSSKFGNAWLVNVTLESGRLFAGFAYFDGGLRGTIKLMSIDKQESIEIQIPERVQHALTHVLMTDVNDRVEFKLANP